MDTQLLGSDARGVAAGDTASREWHSSRAVGLSLVHHSVGHLGSCVVRRIALIETDLRLAGVAVPFCLQEFVAREGCQGAMGVRGRLFRCPGIEVQGNLLLRMSCLGCRRLVSAVQLPIDAYEADSRFLSLLVGSGDRQMI